MVATPPSVIALPGAMLSRLAESDADEVAAAVGRSLEQFIPWLPWAGSAAADPEHQRSRCRDTSARWDAGEEFVYLLRAPATDGRAGRVLGMFGLHRRVGPDAIEIGYWLDTDAVGHGYATAAAGAVTTAGLALPGVDRVEIHTDEANTRSAAVPQRLGYVLDRVEQRTPEAPGETGRMQIWVYRGGGAPPGP